MTVGHHDVEAADEGRPLLLPVTVAQQGGNGAAVGAAEVGARLAAGGTGVGGYGATTTAGEQRSSQSQRGDSKGGSSKKKQPKKPKRPRFLVLDFRRVTAIDMSSIVNCFLPLQTLCKDLGVVLVYAHCNLRVEFYLRSHRLIDDTNTHLLPTLHQALDFCETALLQVGAWFCGGLWVWGLGCGGGWVVCGCLDFLRDGAVAGEDFVGFGGMALWRWLGDRG